MTEAATSLRTCSLEQRPFQSLPPACPHLETAQEKIAPLHLTETKVVSILQFKFLILISCVTPCGMVTVLRASLHRTDGPQEGEELTSQASPSR